MGIDWGKKYIGLAHMDPTNEMIFPIGYVMNDKDVMWQIGEMLMQYHIGRIVVGKSSQRSKVTDKIDDFVKELAFVAGDMIEIEYINEDYTSVEAGDRVGNFQKNVADDTISAMIMLERWIAVKSSEEA